MKKNNKNLKKLELPRETIATLRGGLLTETDQPPHLPPIRPSRIVKTYKPGDRQHESIPLANCSMNCYDTYTECGPAAPATNIVDCPSGYDWC